MIDFLEKKEDLLMSLPDEFNQILGKRLKYHPGLLNLVLDDLNQIKIKYSTLFERRKPKTNKRF